MAYPNFSDEYRAQPFIAFAKMSTDVGLFLQVLILDSPSN